MTRTSKLLIGILAAAAVLGAYWMLILSPKRAEVADLDTQIADKETAVAQAELLVATYGKQRQAYRTNYATLVRLGKAMPGDDDLRSLMIQLDDAASRSGVDFRTIEVGGGATDEPTIAGSSATAAPPGAVAIGSAGYSAMPFKFTFTGRFDNLSGFFSRLEHFVTVQEEQIRVTGRLMRVENITLEPGDKGYPQIQATIGASSYLAPAAKGVSGGSATATPSASKASTGGNTTTTTTTATATGVIR
jgi:hypothetical protein